MLSVEQLESRRLLACTVNLSGGTLTATGDSGENDVSVDMDVLANKVFVWCDNLLKTFDLAQVGDVKLLGKGGDDYLSFISSIELPTGRSAKVQIVGGGGDDNVEAEFFGPIAGHIDVILSGNDGHDDLSLVVDEYVNGTLNATLNGGSGNDWFWPEVVVGFSKGYFVCDGGDGYDILVPDGVMPTMKSIEEI